jgi:hypothetical protein
MTSVMKASLAKTAIGGVAAGVMLLGLVTNAGAADEAVEKPLYKGDAETISQLRVSGCVSTPNPLDQTVTVILDALEPGEAEPSGMCVTSPTPPPVPVSRAVTQAVKDYGPQKFRGIKIADLHKFGLKRCTVEDSDARGFVDEITGMNTIPLRSDAPKQDDCSILRLELPTP